MKNLIGMGSSGLAANLVYDATSFTELRSSRARTAFQWEGTISALLLLIVNWVGRRSALQTTLLVLYLLTSFPTALFKILRGQFGYWIAFLAVAANLFFPETFPVSRFILFVITPEWLANGLRESIAGGVFCVIIAVSLVLVELREIGGLRSCGCNCYCFFFFLVFLYNIVSVLRNLVEK